MANEETISVTSDTVTPPSDNIPDQFGLNVAPLDYNNQIRNKPTNPIYGDGSDGDLIVPTGATKTLSP